MMKTFDTETDAAITFGSYLRLATMLLVCSFFSMALQQPDVCSVQPPGSLFPDNSLPLPLLGAVEKCPLKPKKMPLRAAQITDDCYVRASQATRFP